MKILNGFKMPKLRLSWFLLLFFIYSASVLIFVWWQCYVSPWQGGKNGQLDAYRHTLASAVVAYTISPKLVTLVGTVMERKNFESNLMDKQNNRIGAEIGAKARSLNEVCQNVVAQVAQGTVNASNANQTTWLPQSYWGEALLW